MGRKGLPSDLLSNHIWIMAGLDFEGTIVGPQIYRDANAGDSALINLRFSQYVRLAYRVCSEFSPFLRPRCLRWRIRDRHISSSSQRRAGSGPGSCRRYYGSRRWLVGWSCDSDLPLAPLRRGPASPSFRIPLVLRSIGLISASYAAASGVWV